MSRQTTKLSPEERTATWSVHDSENIDDSENYDESENDDEDYDDDNLKQYFKPRSPGHWLKGLVHCDDGDWSSPVKKSIQIEFDDLCQKLDLKLIGNLSKTTQRIFSPIPYTPYSAKLFWEQWFFC